MSQIIASGLSSDIDHQSYEINIDWDNQYFDIILTSESGLTFDDVKLGSVQIGSSYYAINYEPGQASCYIGSNYFVLDEYSSCPITIRFLKSNISIIKDDVEIQTGYYDNDHVPTTPIYFIDSTVVNNEYKITFDLVLGDLSKGEKIVEYKFNSSIDTLFSEVNEGFTYTYEDIDNGDGTITRTIYSDQLPTKIRFEDCEGLLELLYLNTSELTTLRKTFKNCYNVTSINATDWDTSKITSLCEAFEDCNNLTSLDVSNFDTSNVTDMQYMFNGCNNLTSLDVTNFDTSNVTNMQYMFSNCKNLITLDVSNFDTSNVTNMGCMFQYCESLTTLDVINFNTSNVTDIHGLFCNCYNLTSLDVSNFNTSNVIDMQYMFQYCKNLTTLDVSNFNTSNVIDMKYMFEDCHNITSLNLSNFDTSNVTNMTEMINECYDLTELNISNWHLNSEVDVTNMFIDTNVLINVIMYNSDYNSVNKIIAQLPTRTTDSMGTLNITGIDDISQVDIATAESKYWNILNLKQYKIHLITAGNNKVNKVHNLNKKLKISFYK